MNYYGTRRWGHDLAFHSELQDALFASGLPFVLSINDVPEAWELYSRAGSITRLCLGKNSSKPELSGQSCVWRRNCCCQRRIEAAILRPTQDCHAPGPHRPAPGPHQARASLRPKPRSRPCSDQSRGAGLAFPSLFAHFSAPKRAVTKRRGETVLGPRFGTVTRAYGDMAFGGSIPPRYLGGLTC